MQTALGIAIGFSIIPATILLIGAYAWAIPNLGVSVGDFATGAALGIVVMIVALIIYLRAVLA